MVPWQHPWRAACVSASGPFATACSPRPPTPSTTAGPAVKPATRASSAAGHRSNRAPLLRFCPLQRSKPCCTVRACQPPDDPASVFCLHPCGFALRRLRGPRRGASQREPLRPASHPTPGVIRASTTGPPRRWPRGSFIAGLYAADVPDPPWPLARPCHGLHTRGDAHGVWPFAVLLLPAGCGVFPCRATHLPFPECPPRSVFVEGSVAQCCRHNRDRPRDAHRGS